MDDVTALRDALRTRIDMGANWVEEYRALDGDEERDEGYRQLDALVAAVEARAALTPERLAKALVATTIFAGHARGCPVWTNRMVELRGERVDLDTCTCWVKDEAPYRARRIIAALAQTPPTDAGERVDPRQRRESVGGPAIAAHFARPAPAPITEDALAAALRDILREYVYQPFGAPEAKEAHAAILAAIRGDPIEATKPGPAASGSEGGTDHG